MVSTSLRMIRVVVTLFAVILAIGPTCSSAIQCYLCSSTINSTNVESGSCSKLTGIDASNQTNFLSCSTTYSTSSGNTVITRTGSDSTVENSCSGPTCSCNTDKCNNQVIALSNSLECYECQSSDFFDNGCGKVLKETPYVHKVRGCTACGRMVTIGGDYITRYSRGCSRSVSNDVACHKDVRDEVCVCQSALCNSAQKIQLITLSTFFCVLLSVFKIYL